MFLRFGHRASLLHFLCPRGQYARLGFPEPAVSSNVPVANPCIETQLCEKNDDIFTPRASNKKEIVKSWHIQNGKTTNWQQRVRLTTLRDALSLFLWLIRASGGKNSAENCSNCDSERLTGSNHLGLRQNFKS